jgi:hypothetical protein
MSGRRVAPEDRDTILALVESGESYRAVAAATGWSLGVVVMTVGANRQPGVRLTAAQRAKLGPQVAAWADNNKVLVVDMKNKMRHSGAWTDPPNDTAILLALAEHVHAELVAQTGGVHPTLRAALYRAMGRYGAGKGLYSALGSATTRARKGGVLPRDFWLESNPLNDPAPGWWTAADALYDTLDSLARPSLALRDTGLVAAVVVESAGQAAGLEGALARSLDYYLPVWPTGGTASLPRIDYIADEMKQWADRNDADTAAIYNIGDFDPSGMVIADQLADQTTVTFPELEVRRLGINPVLAAAHNAPAAISTGEEPKGTHIKSEVWLRACDEYGIADPTDKSEMFQAEALDYSTWAAEVAEQLAGDLRGRPVNTARHAPDFVNGDRLLAALSEALYDHDGDPAALMRTLGLEEDDG